MRVKGLWLSLMFGSLLPACVPSVSPTPIVSSCPPTMPCLSPAEATPEPTATPTPTVTPAISTAPTIDSTFVASLVVEGENTVREMGIEPLCLRREDVNDDSIPDWLGLYLIPSPRRQLAAFVRDDSGNWYDLRPLKTSQYGLGEYATCELLVRDVNLDGKNEILLWGYASGGTALLHVFAWTGNEFELIAPFEGNAGIRVEDTNGDAIDEIVVGYKRADDLVWEVIYTWDGQAYVWTWDRYTWFYADRPHMYNRSTPERAVISYYLALDDRDLPGAYQSFSLSARGQRPYEDWALQYATAVRVEVGNVREISRSEDTIAIVAAYVQLLENRNGRIVVQLWDVEWTTVFENGGWYLLASEQTLLDEWEQMYYR